MLIRNCVIKRLPGGIWLHHTASGYKARLNEEALRILESMAARRGAAEMTEKETFIYGKLSAQGIALEDTGREEDRRLVIRGKSPLESVELEFSGRCNLRCAHCFSSLSQKDMDARTLEKVFAGIDALEPVNLIINGGEAALNPLLPEALAKARERLMRVVLMTNGTVITDDIAALLKKYGLAKAVVSLDFFEENHDALRGAGSFKKTAAGIKLLVSGRVPVFVTAMVREDSAGRLEEFTDFCLAELGVSGVRFSAITPIGRALGGGLGLSTARTMELFNKGLIPAAGESGGTVSPAGSRGFYCNAGVKECFISADGKVYACHYFQNIGEAMGDMAKRALEEIYRLYPQSGAMPVDFDWKKLEKCKACARFARCRGGCRARARIVSGGWHEPDTHSCAMYGVEAAK